MPTLPFGTAPLLERYSVELQVLVVWDAVLELVGFEEVAQLPDVALVQPVHLLLGGCGVFCTSMGFPTARHRAE